MAFCPKNQLEIAQFIICPPLLVLNFSQNREKSSKKVLTLITKCDILINS